MTMNLTLSKYRSFQQTASLRGTFTFLALDHRQNLRRANPRFQDQAELSRFKLDVTRELAPYATAVLLDPEVSAAQAIAAGALPGDRGLVVALEGWRIFTSGNSRTKVPPTAIFVAVENFLPLYQLRF
jgi:tagatose 1,6-diphosphate aldolase